ncbi:MAG: pantoate--beta-alanine ligase [Saprospiraceae bacterium]
MLLVKTAKDLQTQLNRLKTSRSTIGFVPTMGALHEGHLSLIKKSKETTHFTVCSIFVNPTQFNDTADLDKYPRTTTRDIELLNTVDTDILFLPSVEEIYPQGLANEEAFDFRDLATVMEGKFRPGHFDGMAQVVKRLLALVGPDQLFMGQKDFQQLTIVRDMLRQMDSNIELKMCEIVREPDGLAMSSRNVRLTPEIRAKTPIIYQVLQEARQRAKVTNPAAVSAWAMQTIQAQGLRPEYFELVDGISLKAINDFDFKRMMVACTAVWAGDVRLIDNILI